MSAPPQRHSLVASNLTGNGTLFAFTPPSAIFAIDEVSADRAHVPIGSKSSGQLFDVVNADLTAGDDGVARTIRDLIETVTTTPAERGSSPGIVVRGRLQSLLELDPFQNGSLPGVDRGAG
jgi:hypothetical protein